MSRSPPRGCGTRGRIRSDAFKRHRCVVPMDGFYEWKTLPDGKQPYIVKGDEPLAAAGLWDSWKDPIGRVQAAPLRRADGRILRVEDATRWEAAVHREGR